MWLTQLGSDSLYGYRQVLRCDKVINIRLALDQAGLPIKGCGLSLQTNRRRWRALQELFIVARSEKANSGKHIASLPLTQRETLPNNGKALLGVSLQVANSTEPSLD